MAFTGNQVMLLVFSYDPLKCSEVWVLWHENKSLLGEAKGPQKTLGSFAKNEGLASVVLLGPRFMWLEHQRCLTFPRKTSGPDWKKQKTSTQWLHPMCRLYNSISHGIRNVYLLCLLNYWFFSIGFTHPQGELALRSPAIGVGGYKSLPWKGKRSLQDLVRAIGDVADARVVHLQAGLQLQ